VEYAEVRSLQFQDAELHRFSAYPNPFAEQLVLKGLQADEPTRVRLLNAQGQVVRQQQLRAEQRPALQLEQLPKGAYLLQVHQNGRAYMRRVIKR
jgi:hypothetical protein